MSYKQFNPVKKDNKEAKIYLIRFLTTEEQVKKFDEILGKKGEKASEVLRTLVEEYINKK